MSSSFTTDLGLVNLFYFNNHNNHPVDLLIGEIIIWPTNSNYPKGFLLCDGSSYSTTEYSELYAIIGTTYGSGSGTFLVPDFRNKHIRSGNVQGNNIQSGTNSGKNTINTTNLPSHSHSIIYAESNWNYAVSNNIKFTLSGPLKIDRCQNTYSYEPQGETDMPRNESRATTSHTHSLSYNSNTIANSYNTEAAIDPVTIVDSPYINNASLNCVYNTTTTPFTGGSSYVPKSKKVYYLIYSGKH